jgi:hypothetical protein
MTLNTAQGAFTVIGPEATGTTYYWKGVPLTEVLGMVANVDDDTFHVRLRVQNTTNFDAAYAEMTTAGIKIKKVGG